MVNSSPLAKCQQFVQHLSQAPRSLTPEKDHSAIKNVIRFATNYDRFDSFKLSQIGLRVSGFVSSDTRLFLVDLKMRSLFPVRESGADELTDLAGLEFNFCNLEMFMLCIPQDFITCTEQISSKMTLGFGCEGKC